MDKLYLLTKLLSGNSRDCSPG